MRILKPSELCVGDVVRYRNWVGPFADMEVNRLADNGVYIRRAYMQDGKALYEECFWLLDSNFGFKLVESYSRGREVE